MTKGERLLSDLIHRKPRGKEWLKLEKDIHEYLEFEATDSEKKFFKQYMEMLSMTCRAVESM